MPVPPVPAQQNKGENKNPGPVLPGIVQYLY